MVKSIILDYLDDGEFKSAGEISEECDIPLPQVVTGLKTLRQDGLISRENRSNKFLYGKTGEENQMSVATKSEKKETPAKAVVKEDCAKPTANPPYTPLKITGYKVSTQKSDKVITIFVDRRASAKSISFSLAGLTDLLKRTA